MFRTPCHSARDLAHTSSDLASADFDGDGDVDVFALDEDATAACVYANAGDARGAELSASGNARLAHDTLVLHASGTTHSAVLCLQGTQNANGGLGTPFGDGLIGVAGTLRRLATTPTSAGAASFPVGDARPIHVLGGVAAASTRTYQALYRDPANHCTASTFNLTNALVVTWMP